MGQKSHNINKRSEVVEWAIRDLNRYVSPTTKEIKAYAYLFIIQQILIEGMFHALQYLNCFDIKAMNTIDILYRYLNSLVSKKPICSK